MFNVDDKIQIRYPKQLPGTGRVVLHQIWFHVNSPGWQLPVLFQKSSMKPENRWQHLKRERLRKARIQRPWYLGDLQCRYYINTKIEQ